MDCYKIVLFGLIVILFGTAVSAQEVTCNSCESCTKAASVANAKIKVSQDFKAEFEKTWGKTPPFVCIIVGADGVTLDCDNKVIDGGGEAISFLGAYKRKEITIKNCKVKNFNPDSALVFFRHSKYSTLEYDGPEDLRLEGNEFTGNGGLIVIDFQKSKRIKVRGNRIINNSDATGIAISEVEDVEIANNVISGNGVGIYVGSDGIIREEPNFRDLRINHNEISNNKVNLKFKTRFPRMFIDARHNYWRTKDCNKVREAFEDEGSSFLGGGSFVLISPILSNYPRGEEISCEYEKKKTELMFEYYADTGLILAAVKDEYGKLYPQVKITLFFGVDMEIPLTTDSSGTAMLDTSHEERLVERLETAKAVFEGNEYLKPAQSKLKITPILSTKNECKLLWRGASSGKKLNVVFVVRFDSAFKTLANSTKGGNKLIFYNLLVNELVGSMIDTGGKGKGFGSVEPFKSNLDKFDFYLYVEWRKPEKKLVMGAYLAYLNTIQNCKADRVIFFDPKSLRGSGGGGPFEKTAEVRDVFGSLIARGELERISVCVYAKCSLYVESITELGKISPFNIEGSMIVDGVRIYEETVIHETGHLFGLRDEYVEEEMDYSRPGYPNCAENREKANKWWKDFVGKGVGDLKVTEGFYDGCSYVETNVRSNNNTIMRYPGNVKDEDWLHGYGPVNEWFIGEILKKYG